MKGRALQEKRRERAVERERGDEERRRGGKRMEGREQGQAAREIPPMFIE